jgi:hypothetical protein
MLRSKKSQAIHRRRMGGLAIPVLIAGVLPVSAQVSAQTTSQAGGSGAPIVRPPVARQIEPAVGSVAKAPGSQQVSPQTSTLAAGLAPPAAAAGAHQPSVTPKIVVYTCKLGQDFSEKLKACFTPGVNKVVTAAKAVKAKLGAEIETAKRSALGAAKKKS